MITMRGDTFVLAAVFVVAMIANDSKACFTENQEMSYNILAESSFYQSCHCTEPGHTAVKLKWLGVDGREIGEKRPGTSPRVYTEKSGSGLSLLIPLIGHTMSGMYKCVTENNGKMYFQSHQLTVYDPVQFITPDQQLIINGQDSLVACEARGVSQPLISWEYNDAMINTNEKYEITSKGLMIKNVKNEDEGIYKCTASVLDTGENVDKNILVKVLTIPTVKQIKALPNAIVVAGDSLSIECNADGVPHPEYHWNKTSGSAESLKEKRWKQIKNKIYIDKVQPTDRGNYSCTAQNAAGENTSEISIEVLYPPIITDFKDMNATEGSIVQISCTAKGFPRPTNTIQFQGNFSENTSVLTSSEKHSDSETGLHVTFMKVDRSHAGVYTCNASNEVDTTSADIYLTVLHKPYFEETYELIWAWEGLNINLNCEHASNPDSNVSWSFIGNELTTTEVQIEINEKLSEIANASDDITNVPLNISDISLYGLYQCHVNNEYGDATKTILVRQGFAPPEVTNVTVSNITATTVKFNIEEPQNIEGPYIMGFTAEYDDEEAYNETSVHQLRTWSKDRPFRLSNLKPNKTYYVRFMAINEVGTGPWSEFIQFETPEKSVPEAPTWDDEDMDLESRPILKWKAPIDNGDPIDYYIIKYCQMNYGVVNETACTEEQIDSTTEWAANKLETNTTYLVQLTAHNSEGTSDEISTVVLIPAITEPLTKLSAGTIIGIAIVLVVVCILILDLILLFWRKQGMIASCVYPKSKSRLEEDLQSRDRKGLLNHKDSAGDSLKRPDNRHTEFEYNKSSGVLTGKHSAV